MPVRSPCPLPGQSPPLHHGLPPPGSRASPSFLPPPLPCHSHQSLFLSASVPAPCDLYSLLLSQLLPLCPQTHTLVYIFPRLQNPPVGLGPLIPPFLSLCSRISLQNVLYLLPLFLPLPFFPWLPSVRLLTTAPQPALAGLNVSLYFFIKVM